AVLPELKAHGVARRGWLGITVEDNGDRVIVSEVVEGGPAARGGVHVGDVIDSLDQSPVRQAVALRWKVAMSGAGHKISLKIKRGDEALSVKLLLDDIPN